MVITYRIMNRLPHHDSSSTIPIQSLYWQPSPAFLVDDAEFDNFDDMPDLIGSGSESSDFTETLTTILDACDLYDYNEVSSRGSALSSAA